MYTALIVDDEILSRYALQALLSKHVSDIQIIGECEDGAQAIEKNKLLHPDIIIMDIKMPGMSGLEASKIILENTPSVHILIMTAYDNFEYIQKALSIGVKGYLLKPLIANEIIESMDTVFKSIDKKKKASAYETEHKELYSLTLPIIRKNLVFSYANGHIDSKEIQRAYQLMHISFSPGYFMLCMFRSGSDNSHTSDRQLSLYKQSILDNLQHRLSFFKNILIGDFYVDILPVFIHVNNNYDLAEVLSQSDYLSREIISLVMTKYKLNVSITMGNIYDKAELFKNSYYDALSIINDTPANTVKHYVPQDSLRQSTPYPYDLEKLLLDNIRQKKMEDVHSMINQLLQRIYSNHNSLTLKREYSIQLLASVKRCIAMHGIDTAYMDSVPLLSQMESIPSQFNLQEYVYNTLIHFCNIAEKKNANKNYALVQKINAYVQNEPICNLSLEGLADFLNLTPQYVSKIFKEEYHENFSDYLTDKKISYAKELLEKCTYSVREISELSGYNDQNYFSRIFRKATGLTPKEYQKYAKNF